ncbi:MAG: hypothetical protein K6T92_02665 [Candidatus Rokubacteria bacterium]|nr:hypothetical protein [Candidatus Rokubacteria bacterium]
MSSNGAQVSSIARGEIRLPFETRAVGDGYAAPGPVITRRLTPEELERYRAMRDGHGSSHIHIVDPLVGDRRVMLAAMEAVRAAGIELHSWPPDEEELRAVADIGFSAAMIARLYRINVAQAKGRLDRLGIELRGDWRPGHHEPPEQPRVEPEPTRAADAQREEVEGNVPLTWPASKTELEDLVRRGLSNAEIGRRYGVSAHTVSMRLLRLGVRRDPETIHALERRRAKQRPDEGQRPQTPVAPTPAATAAAPKLEVRLTPVATLQGKLVQLGGEQEGALVLLDGDRALRVEDAIRAVLIDAGEWRGRIIRIEVA